MRNMPEQDRFDDLAADFSVVPEIRDSISEFIALRRDLHATPELCFQEFKTSELVSRLLSQWGIQTHCGLGGTGVVGVLRSGQSKNAIGLRADMDALPIQEQNTFPHASKVTGKMHACGHDGHTAMLLAAAKHLSDSGCFDGTVYFIFQPAEEGGGGAAAMIKDGLFEKFPMQAVYGMHNWPGIAVGRFAISPGPVMAAFDTFRIVIIGKGCHAALPHMGLDPVPVAAQLVLGLQTILTRSANPLDAGVLSITTMHVGETTNVIADSCELTGTIRTFSADLMDLIQQRMREISNHICQAYGMTCNIEFFKGYPPTVNHAAQVEISKNVMVDLVGEDNVLVQLPVMGAEDFAFMLQQLPGSYCFIGNGQGDHRLNGHASGPCMLHNPSYDFNDEILALGASYWVKLVETCLPG